MNQRRLFFGIPLSSQTSKGLLRRMDEWQDLPLFLTHEGNLHVTMFFLGFVDNTEIPDICTKAEEVVANLEPFDMEFTDIALAPDTENPSMIWLRGEPSDGALILRNALERAFTQKTADNKAFRPHVTLARLRRNRWRTCDTKPVFPLAFAGFEPVSSLTLFEVTSEEGKRRYAPIAEFPFGGQEGDLL